MDATENELMQVFSDETEEPKNFDKLVMKSGAIIASLLKIHLPEKTISTKKDLIQVFSDSNNESKHFDSDAESNGQEGNQNMCVVPMNAVGCTVSIEEKVDEKIYVVSYNSEQV